MSNIRTFFLKHPVGDSQSWTSEKCERNPFLDFTDENSYKGQPCRILKNYRFEASGEPKCCCVLNFVFVFRLMQWMWEIRGGYLGEHKRAKDVDVCAKCGRRFWVHSNQNSRSWTSFEKNPFWILQMKSSAARNETT